MIEEINVLSLNISFDDEMTLANEVVLLRTDLEEAREQIATLECQLESADNENENLIKDNMSLRRELEALQADSKKKITDLKQKRTVSANAMKEI